MTILFISPSLPNRLHRIRAFNLIKYLSKAGHKIHLVSLWKKNQFVERDFLELKKYCVSIDLIYLSLWKSLFNCALFLFSPLPLEVAYCRSKKMEKAVKKAVEKYIPDAVYIKRLRAAQFAEYLLEFGASGGRKPKIFLDSSDAMSMFYRRAAKGTKNIFEKILFWEEYFKYGIYEKRLFKKFKNWVLCSQIDIDYLKNSTSCDDVGFLLVLGIADEEELESKRRAFEGKSAEKNTIIFSGLMDKFVNIDGISFFMEEIWPLLKKEIPDAKIYICGPNPVFSVRKFHNGKDVIVTGFAPQLEEYILKSRAVVCPIRVGAGMRNKILQAFFLGRPVVSTSAGAKGIDVKDNKNILIADDPKKFANGITTLLKNEKLWQNLADEGLKLAKQKYSIKAAVAVLEKELGR